MHRFPNVLHGQSEVFRTSKPQQDRSLDRSLALPRLPWKILVAPHRFLAVVAALALPQQQISLFLCCDRNL
jgi:hypothetical protein